MKEYEVEVEITLKVTLEDVEAATEEEAGRKAEEEVRKEYQRKMAGITQIDKVEAVWIDEYLDGDDSDTA